MTSGAWKAPRKPRFLYSNGSNGIMTRTPIRYKVLRLDIRLWISWKEIVKEVCNVPFFLTALQYVRISPDASGYKKASRWNFEEKINKIKRKCPGSCNKKNLNLYRCIYNHKPVLTHPAIIDDAMFKKAPEDTGENGNHSQTRLTVFQACRYVTSKFKAVISQ